MKPGKGPRGYVLLFVLMILLVLSLVVASLYSQAQELRSANLTASFQQVAAVNADRGVQAAIQAMRAGTITAPTGTCNPGHDYRANCAGGPGVGYQELGIATADGGIFILENPCPSPGQCSPAEGAGLQYTWYIYRSDSPTNPTNRFTVHATGYAGMSEQALNLVTAEVEVEIELGTLQFQCSNSYECNGG